MKKINEITSNLDDDANIHKIGLLIENPNQLSLGHTLLSSLNYSGIPLKNYQDFLKVSKDIDILMIDEHHAKTTLKKIKETIKENENPILIILVVEKNKNVDNWVDFDIDDVIQAPLEKLDLMLALNRIIKLKRQIESRLEDLRKFSENILNQTTKNWTQEHLRQFLQFSPYGILIESNNKIVFANDKCLKILNLFEESSILNNEIDFFFKASEISKIKNKFKIAQDQKTIIELLDEQMIKLDGSVVDVEIIAAPFVFENQSSVQLIINDVTKRKKAEQELAHLANYDSNTGLANRFMLENMINQSILLAQRKKEKFAIFVLGLDHFKIINETLGFTNGDLLLKKVGERLASTIRRSDLVARLSGDEFALVLMGVSKIEAAAKVAEKIMHLFKTPFMVDKNEIYITSSIGISIFPENGNEITPLLKNADIAMYLAKDQGRNKYQFCTNELTQSIQERTSLENDLRLAINANQLVLHYQPIYDLKTNQISGIEALLRWQHPQKGLIYPGVFITLAEETGLIAPITEWVINKVCEDNQIWKKANIPQLQLSINLSVSNLKQENIIELVNKILKKTHIPPEFIEFEITETMIMKDVEQMHNTFDKLKNMGIHIAIDDFGIGYSSLSVLKKFNIDRLKIDRLFVKGSTTNSNDAGIIKAIIAMSHQLNMKVIAEGVETKEEFEFLKKEDCDEIQGYYFSKPLPADELIQFFQTHHHPH